MYQKALLQGPLYRSSNGPAKRTVVAQQRQCQFKLMEGCVFKQFAMKVKHTSSVNNASKYKCMPFLSLE